MKPSRSVLLLTLSLVFFSLNFTSCGGGTITPQTTEISGEMDLLIGPPQNQIKYGTQDLQVTIEVRFITVNDNFFERIGVDFDFNVQDNLRGGSTTVDGVGEIGIQLDPNNPSNGTVFKNDSQGQALGESDINLNFALGLNGQTFEYGTSLLGFSPTVNLSDQVVEVLVRDLENQERSLRITDIRLNILPIIQANPLQEEIPSEEFPFNPF